jgi:hypothetical protein
MGRSSDPDELRNILASGAGQQAPRAAPAGR